MDDAETIWHTIAARNDWRLTEDDPAFVADAIRGVNDADQSAVELALLCAYRRRMYAALQRGDDRAAEELHRTCYLRGRRNGMDEETAADVAQETMRRVLEHLEELHAPEALVSWALVIQRSIVRDRSQRKQAVSLEAGLAAGTISEPAEPQDDVAASEWRIVAGQLAGIIERTLTNPMERLAIVRIVLGDEKPREVAHDLDVPLHQIRVHKHRALQRLRADPAFMAACEQLAFDAEGVATEKERTDDSFRRA